MPDLKGPKESVPADPRRAELLSAAIQVFARYGYKRASMDQVARAAGLSRQGLYLHFPAKEALFREVVAHVLDQSLRKGTAILAEAGRPLAERLVAAFDAVYGQYLDSIGPSQHLAELLETSVQLLGNLIRDQEQAFRQAVASALEQDGIAAAWAPVGLSPRDLAETLDAVAHGLKGCVASQAAFLPPMRKAVLLITARPASR